MRAILVVCAMLIAWPARAQLDVESAKAHFAAGSHDFEAGRFADALGEFEKAYKLSGRAPLLYNIALCHERLGHAAQAIEAFERYLQSLPPDSFERPDAEMRLAHLRPPPKPAAPPRLDLVASPPPRGTRPVYKRAWFWGVMGGAAAVVVAGVTVGVVLGTRGSTRVLRDVRPQ
jgi:tetratricopeptide (TPR) repeat protein